MNWVGIRELRDNLSKHLAEVKEGKTVTITDHGKVIARIVPAGRPTTLERLIAEGRVTPAKRRKSKALPPPIKTKKPISLMQTVIDERREGW